MKKIIAKNKKALHDYEVLKKYEAGISLKGTEVKAIRAGKVNLKNSYVAIYNNEAFLENCHISEYDMGNYSNHNPLDTRKLLLHKREIVLLANSVDIKGLTIVPLSIYLVKNKIKLEIALAKGRKLWDKREHLANKTSQRDVARIMKSYTI